jgi:hypothetical protein
MFNGLPKSSDLHSLPLHEHFYALADAYLDSAIRLTKVLARSPKKVNYQRGQVTMFLAHHSIELFLKGAVLQRSPQENLGRYSHNLASLHDRYHALYPEKRFELQVPFTVTTDLVRPEHVELARRAIRQRAERLRYPIDKSGGRWSGIDAYHARWFRESLERIQKRYEAIRRAIDA